MPKRKIAGGTTLPTTTTSMVEGWTLARYRTFITSAIRSGFRRFPNKWIVLKNAFTARKTNKKTGKLAAHYRCAGCKKEYVATEVAVDHVTPVVDPVIGFVNWDTYIQRMYCNVDNLQVLCKECHTKKTAEERKVRTCTNKKKLPTSTQSPASKRLSKKSVQSK